MRVEWLIVGIVVVLIATRILVARYDYAQVKARTRRHLEAGGKLTAAPDVTPPHGGGGAG